MRKNICSSHLATMIYSDAYHQLGKEMDLNVDVNTMSIIGTKRHRQN